MGYKFVADIMGLSLFISPLLPSKITKSREIPIKFDLIRVQDHPRSFDLGVSGEPVCDFLLVVNSNFGLSATVFEILMLKAKKWLNFPTPPLFETPAWGTP